MKVTPFNVMPHLPEPLEPLREIAFNIWFSWNWEAVRLFIRLSAECWQQTYQNPTLMLGVIPQERLEEVMQDESFMANMKRVHANMKSYMAAKTWFDKTYPQAGERTIAYFSTEYGIDVGLPIYSGGLGVLAGDHLKSASDLGLPLVAMGLLYREGYLSQYLSADGWQQEAYPTNDWYNMPVTPVNSPDGEPIVNTIDLAGEEVAFQIWKVQVGRIPLYLLDTDLPQNSPRHRDITTRLYAGERDMRLRQEILLGIGGVKALSAMGIQPQVCHMNEGHSAFLALERVRECMTRHKLSLPEAWEIVWATTVFTTHTPVPAGNERFDPALVKYYLEPYLAQIGLKWDAFLAYGRENPQDPKEEFCLTVLALRHAAHCNGVSKLHGATSRKLWKTLWPNVPSDEVPIKSVTNGIHALSWLSHDMAELFASYIGPRFVEEPMDLDIWKKIELVPDAELWRTHERRRERLVWFARKRIREQQLRRGAPPHLLAEAEQALDPRALTICFARRFAAYKRATLILHDPARLAALLTNPEQPSQIIFAGKAHPLDLAGKELMKQLVHFIREEPFRNRIVFLEDYDINVARYMVQGADLWLNTPRKPLEASGTSGMKAVANGGLHLSTFDGWWCEGYTPDVGWTIGHGEEYADPEQEAEIESGALYDILERDAVPLFHERDKDGLPHRWIKKMKASMEALGAYFNTNRMVSDYTADFYLAAGEKFAALSADAGARARALAEWRRRVHENWSAIRVEQIESNAEDKLTVGDALEVAAKVHLGALSPEDVAVQLYHGWHNQEDLIANGESDTMSPDGDGPDGVYTYRCNVKCKRSGRRAFGIRVLPVHADLVHPFAPGPMLWA